MRARGSAPSHPRLDRVDRHAGARDRRARSRARARRPVSAERSSDALIEQARRFGVDRIALADADAGARAAEQWTDGEVLSGPEGLVRARARVRRRPRPQRARRLGRARSDRRDARRGHRPRARQQGVARRRRRARHGARRGDRRADPARRLRALGAAPAHRRRAAGDDREARADGVRRPVSRALAGRPRGRHASRTR